MVLFECLICTSGVGGWIILTDVCANNDNN